ncbi:MAG: hypothetical protein J5846_08910 [Desulfovibrio sp.]|nr:hypothetical protein [Desulfovibrio sp.]
MELGVEKKFQLSYHLQPSWRRPDAQYPLTDTLIQSFQPFFPPILYLWSFMPRFPSFRSTSRQRLIDLPVYCYIPVQGAVNRNFALSAAVSLF